MLIIELLITLNIQDSRFNNATEQNNVYNVHVRNFCVLNKCG